jgi:poly-gamma-glutamate synthesis protein (capsule biosynthesis protein)
MVKAGLSRRGLVDLEAIPYRIGPRGLGLLRGEAKSDFLASLRAVSEPLDRPGGCLDAWNGFLRYKGQQGFEAEVRQVLGEMAGNPKKGAAMFRNRLTTLQHREQWLDLLTRIMEDRIDAAPQWAYDLVAEWQTREIPAAAQP